MDWNRTQQVMHKWPPFAVPHVQLQQQPAIQHHIPHPQPHIQQPHPGLQHMQQPQPTQPQAPAQPAAKASRNNTPHCLVCNVHLGMFAKGGVEVFSDKVTTTHGKQQVHTILGNILNEELVNQGIHSSIICKKCFKLIDDIDALDDKITGMKQVVSNKYTMTLSLVKRGLVGKAVIDDDMKESLSKSARKDSTEEISAMKKARKAEKPRKIPIKREEVVVNVDVPRPDVHFSEGIEEKGFVPTPDETNEEGDGMMDHDHADGNPDTVETQDDDHTTYDDDGTVDHETSPKTEVDKDDDGSLECSVCDKPFETKEALYDHLEFHGPREDWLYCNVCDKPFLSEKYLMEHQKIHRVKRKYTKRGSGKKKGVKGLKGVKGAKKRKGVKVKKERKEPTERVMKRSKSSKNSYKCQYCSEVFTNKTKRMYHERMHTEVKRFKCKHCDKEFTTITKCKFHEKSIHADLKPYECDICGMNFKMKSTMVTHKSKVHLQERNFKCNVCGKAFGYKRLLQCHVMAAHTGERPYTCEYCDKGFVYQQHLETHLRIHTGEKPFSCDVCGMSFSSRNNCRTHMFSHTNKKPYECTVCGHGFMRKKMAISHIEQHAHVVDPEDYIKLNSPTDGEIGLTKSGSMRGPKRKPPQPSTSAAAAAPPPHQLAIEDNVPHFIIPAEARESANLAEPMSYLFGSLQTPHQAATHYTPLNLGQW